MTDFYAFTPERPDLDTVKWVYAAISMDNSRSSLMCLHKRNSVLCAADGFVFHAAKCPEFLVTLPDGAYTLTTGRVQERYTELVFQSADVKPIDFTRVIAPIHSATRVFSLDGHKMARTMTGKFKRDFDDLDGWHVLSADTSVVFVSTDDQRIAIIMQMHVGSAEPDTQWLFDALEVKHE